MVSKTLRQRSSQCAVHSFALLCTRNPGKKKPPQGCLAYLQESVVLWRSCWEVRSAAARGVLAGTDAKAALLENVGVPEGAVTVEDVLQGCATQFRAGDELNQRAEPSCTALYFREI